MEPSIEKWGREKYPRLIENEKLIEALFRRHVLHKSTPLVQVTAYPLRKIAELEPDKVVSLVVVKVEATVSERPVCKVCNRSEKNCKDSTHGTEKIPFYVINMLAGDDSGIEKFQHIGIDKEAVDVIMNGGENFVVTGALKIHERFGREFDVKSFARLSGDQVEAWEKLIDYYSIHGGMDGITDAEFDKVLEGKQELLAPLFEKIYVSRQDGRVRV